MKKKALLGTIVLATALFVGGCGKTEELTCTREATIAGGAKMSLNYKVTHKGGIVKLVETEEKVTSENEQYLETYKTTVESLYSPYDDVEHYNYEVKIDGDTLISKTEINYEKIDTKKLIEIDSANENLIKNGKIKVDDIKSAYESIGATCK
ncbi:MAG: YehR family protein [Bacilli bacterium]|nr:YehR family protein [Bacilli bacterium]